jgi:hypothetical protein
VGWNGWLGKVGVQGGTRYHVMPCGILCYKDFAKAKAKRKSANAFKAMQSNASLHHQTYQECSRAAHRPYAKNMGQDDRLQHGL